jgi:hypothetical protein
MLSVWSVPISTYFSDSTGKEEKFIGYHEINLAEINLNKLFENLLICLKIHPVWIFKIEFADINSLILVYPLGCIVFLVYRLGCIVFLA